MLKLLYSFKMLPPVKTSHIVVFLNDMLGVLKVPEEGNNIMQSPWSPRNPGSLDLVLMLPPILVALCQVPVWSSVSPPFAATPTCSAKIKSLIWESTFHYKNAVNSHLRQKSDSRAHPEAMSQHMLITFPVSDMSFCYISHKLVCFQTLPCGVYFKLLGSGFNTSKDLKLALQILAMQQHKNGGFKIVFVKRCKLFVCKWNAIRSTLIFVILIKWPKKEITQFLIFTIYNLVYFFGLCFKIWLLHDKSAIIFIFGWLSVVEHCVNSAKACGFNSQGTHILIKNV